MIRALSLAGLALFVAACFPGGPGDGLDQCGANGWEQFTYFVRGWHCQPFDSTYHPTTSGKGIKVVPLGDGGVPVCPADPKDPPCVACMKASCCAESLACDADPVCGPGGDDTFATVAECMANHCDASCGRVQ